jgi:hypothetical protein
MHRIEPSEHMNSSEDFGGVIVELDQFNDDPLS